MTARRTSKRNRAGIPEDWIVRGAIGDEGFEIETESYVEVGRLFEDLSRKIERAGGGFIRVQHRKGRPGMWHEVIETSYGRGRWHTQYREPQYEPHGRFEYRPHGYERHNQTGGKRTAKRSSNRAGRTTNPIAIVQDMPQGHYVASSHYTQKAAVAAARKRGASTVLEVPENRLYQAIWYVVIPKAQ